MIFYGETYSDQLAIIFIVFFTIKKNQLKKKRLSNIQIIYDLHFNPKAWAAPSPLQELISRGNGDGSLNQSTRKPRFLLSLERLRPFAIGSKQPSDQLVNDY